MQNRFPDSMEMRSPETPPSNSPPSDGLPALHASSLQGENASPSSCNTQIDPSFEAWSPQSPLSTLQINPATPTGYAPTPVDRKNTEFTWTPMALNYEPWYGDLPGYPGSAGDGGICTCFVAIMCAVQEAHSDSGEKESVCYKLRLNRDSLSIMKDFLACKHEHDPSLIVLAHVLLYKVTATFVKAVSMPCDRIFHFGSRTIEGPDVEALRRKITSIGIQKVKSMLKQLSRMAKGWKVEGRENIYGPVCAFIQSSVRKQADSLLKRVGG
ncbi:hypothetical protein MPH_12501 [Macrophomina phaseolina MS6]|uniref:Uncharacterized protein n=1 Tax=Macrophomina phaseolina (strain MS6) TaxID=1126212 RepID=K2RBX1_MACPH|nr:hypothetical protein MPH_12501 [Macrophomina phaseolina MS6]